MVSFPEEDLEMVQHPHNDALVISLQIRECQVKRILVDQGSSCDIMYVRCYKELGLHQDDLKQSNGPMVGLNGTPTWPLGAASLEVQAGTKRIKTEFTIIDTPPLIMLSWEGHGYMQWGLFPQHCINYCGSQQNME